LITSFSERKRADPVLQRSLVADQLVPLGLELRRLLPQRRQLGLRRRLPLQRRTGEIVPAERHRLPRLGVELVDRLTEGCLLELQPLLRRCHLGHAAAHVGQQLHLPLVAVIERLLGALGPFEQPRQLGLDDQGGASEQRHG
jgi:hypothetical protein